ncbi:hypothetical protein [Coleofasciculus sp. FACHB-1120]|uniref:hypothetical protein n=1 Tax=Coleofasciculus sp. FACHB-1120 TaxID=2692783 RepID=UPI001689F8D8|nr:hypothetical protein [Coleofasciculus sp. FACHB-1120]MBD2744849.1 hypothetical protein [Coleofasciculus sp. FACHB-1120]
MNRQLKNPSIFQQIFFTVVTLTLLSGVGAIALSTQSNLSSQQNRIFEICNTTWNLGIGAIFGLLGSTEFSKPVEDNEVAKK